MTTERKDRRDYFPLALQISARAREQFELPLELLREPPPSLLRPMQQLARDLTRKTPERPVSAAQLNLLALLNRIFRTVAGRFLEAHRCIADADGLRIDGEPVQLPGLPPVLNAFVDHYPPAEILHGAPAERFFRGEHGPANRRDTLIELFILATQMSNPAAANYNRLFDDRELRQSVPYRETLAELDRRLQKVPVPGLLGRSLLALLRVPIEASPDSLAGQVAAIREQWRDLLPADLLQSLLVALDVVAEEETMRGFGPGPAMIPEFRADFHFDEPEAFSPDTDWMPKVVLIAKSVYVWLDQLSKKYGRHLTRLDQIPTEELDRLARWGFTSLWLIGLWERSRSSQKIKQIMGNPEAVSSAYSLYDYTVADDLGGDEALATLEARCLERGIRLASDVVPNHTGLFSHWTLEHPDWYIQVDQPPYIGYRYSGPDLSFDSRISLYIEDGYWDHSDAAVVFKHVDNRTGRVRFIYHGNDGTHMPWNDTAQLNYLLPEVREAMIQTIVRVARRFRVIRFDAAMTLAKKHFQRLWFPQPGGGAGVPSRAEHWMDREAFERVFPVEFWREVVDRVAAEVPDTLLIAEAFWLMEGYFVRTLGMHRVYNSAFMNMFKQEENAKYRGVIKNILEFNPAILQRFVNFMNNPDEATAVEQFGKSDKYFGVAIMLVTMPGLPMIGHGQVEGLKEKYGMEYRRAYWDETPDEAFIRHHEAQIFPLMHRRYLFSGADQFELYDFASGGHVDENVFAYSNGRGTDKALVVYHNRYGETGGWIGRSTPKNLPRTEGETRLVTTTLAQALGLAAGPDHYLRFRDHRSGLEYLRPSGAIADQGLHLNLGPYQYHVFLDFHEMHDAEGIWGQLYREIGDRPVASLDWELRRVRYAPLIRAFKQAADPSLLQGLEAAMHKPSEQWQTDPGFEAFAQSYEQFLEILAETAPLPVEPRQAFDRMLQDLEAVRILASLTMAGCAQQPAVKVLAEALGDGERGPQLSRVLLPYLALHRLAEPATGVRTARSSARWLEEYLLEDTLRELQSSEGAADEARLVKLLVRHQHFWSPAGGRRDFSALLDDEAVRRQLWVHWADGQPWFNRERFEELGYWLFLAAAVEGIAHFAAERQGLIRHLNATHRELVRLLELGQRAGYQLDAFRTLLREDQQARYPRPKIGRRTGGLKILLVASEVTPFAKSGGLADVAGALPPALRRLGHDVRVIMPCYKTMVGRDELQERPVASVEVDIAGVPKTGVLYRGELNEVPVYFVQNQEFFERDGLYGTADGDYGDNARRFGFFCRAALAALPQLDFRPDVIHLNDWQTSLMPVLLRTELKDDPFYAGAGTLLTIHNLGYQGMFGPGVLGELGLDPGLATMDKMEYFGNVSFLKGGLVFSDQLTTVSETYCREIQTPEMGIGFDGILRDRSPVLHGIVNGLDTVAWDPASDPALRSNYQAGEPENKAANKRALQQELGLREDPEVPVVAMVTRLDTQKGLEIVEQAWDGLMQRHLQFVLLGTGEHKHMERFARLRDRYPGRVSINLTFDDALSRRIYAGADLFLMPSLYEPCGLGQLIALRYGAIPLVRQTGGLADTVTDPEQDAANANGFVFREPSAGALLGTLDRALSRYADRPAWQELVRRGMTRDFSWTRSAERYLALYAAAVEARNG